MKTIDKLNKYNSLVPGTYILTKTVSNPKPDKRFRWDWTKRTEVLERTVFQVEKSINGNTSMVRIRDQPHYFLMYYEHEGFEHEGFKDQNTFLLNIAEHLEPVVETPSQYLERTEGSYCGQQALKILDMLVKDEIPVTFDIIKKYSEHLNEVDNE